MSLYFSLHLNAGGVAANNERLIRLKTTLSEISLVLSVSSARSPHFVGTLRVPNSDAHTKKSFFQLTDPAWQNHRLDGFFIGRTYRTSVENSPLLTIIIIKTRHCDGAMARLIGTKTMLAQ